MLFYMNSSKDKNGIVHIMGRATINRAVPQFSYKQSIPKNSTRKVTKLKTSISRLRKSTALRTTLRHQIINVFPTVKHM